MITKESYLANPCRAASLPFWKENTTAVPANVKIVHQDDFIKAKYQDYFDEQYFRLLHGLQNLSLPVLPKGYSLCSASINDYAAHINQCYAGTTPDAAELLAYTTRPVFNSSLWLAVKNEQTDKIVATAIAELDQDIGEGILEWIQVSEDYRHSGLGYYMVCELLFRMKGIANFATVSGQCGNPTHPERLYRKCGFSGTDVWHILKAKV